MAVKDIEDLAAEKFLSSSDVDARIAHLRAVIARGEENPEDEDQGELEALEAFRDEVTGYTGPARWNNGMTLVGDHGWNEWAEDEAESLYGKAAVESDYFEFARFEQDLQDSDYEAADLNGTAFWFAKD